MQLHEKFLHDGGLMMMVKRSMSSKFFRFLMFAAVMVLCSACTLAQADDSVPMIGLVKGTNVRVRTAPSLNSKEIMQLSGGYVFVYGDPVEADGHDWHKVKVTVANGKTLKKPVQGWISDKFLSDEYDEVVGTSSDPEASIAVPMLVKGTNVRVRTAPSITAKEITQISGGFVFVSNFNTPVAAEGHDWCKVFVTEVNGKKLKKVIKGWMSSNFLDERYYPN